MQVPRYWREQNERYNLTGSQCGNCGLCTFPRRTLCPECRHLSVGKMEDVGFSGKGELVSWTIVHQGPENRSLETPYVLGIVELEEGPRVTAEIVDIDPDELGFGHELEVRFRKLGESGQAGVIHYGYKFGPVARPG